MNYHMAIDVSSPPRCRRDPTLTPQARRCGASAASSRRCLPGIRSFLAKTSRSSSRASWRSWVSRRSTSSTAALASASSSVRLALALAISILLSVAHLFFIGADSTGAPRPVVNSKGRRRRPGTKTLAQVLKSDDELFVDFIAKCLTWDPDRRLKPEPALRRSS